MAEMLTPAQITEFKTEGFIVLRVRCQAGAHCYVLFARGKEGQALYRGTLAYKLYTSA
jgi:hypothetical protein